MRIITGALLQEKNKLSTPSAWLNLLQIHLPDDSVKFYVPNFEQIVFDGITYEPFAFRIDSVKSDTRGGLDTVQVDVSNITREVSAFVEKNDVRGSRVRRLLVNSDNLADPAAIALDEEFEITAVSVREDVVTFTLGHERLLQQRFPNGLFLRDNCRWIYNIPTGRGLDCAFVDDFTGPGTVSSSGVTITGVDTDFKKRFQPADSITAASQVRIVDVVTSDTSMTVTVAPSPVWSGDTYTVKKPTCDKILEGDNGCRAHDNVDRFGAFPGLASVGRRTR